MPGIVHPVVWQTECFESVAMRVANLPTVESAEQPFARHQRLEMRLEVRPCPLGDPDDAITRVRFGATCSYLATLDDVHL
jgi:hypothetical protein